MDYGIAFANPKDAVCLSNFKQSGLKGSETNQPIGH